MNGGCKRGSDCKFIHDAGASNAGPTKRLGATATLAATQTWRSPLPTRTTLPSWRPDAAAFQPSENSRDSRVELPIKSRACSLRPDAPSFQLDDDSRSILPDTMSPRMLKVDAPAFVPSDSAPAAMSAMSVTSPKLSWRPTIVEFEPATTATDLDSSQATICRYFSNGTCRNGIGCSFRHDNPESNSKLDAQASVL